MDVKSTSALPGLETGDSVCPDCGHDDIGGKDWFTFLLAKITRRTPPTLCQRPVESDDGFSSEEPCWCKNSYHA